MGQNSKIEWTHHTANFWWGCVEVSPGCDHCYAREWAKRCGHEVWGVDAPRFFMKSTFDKVLKWQKLANAAGERHRVFTQSMSDIGEVLPEKHEHRAQMDEVRRRVFEELIPQCPDLDFLVLTKRVGNIAKVVPADWMTNGFPANVWMGISVVNQEEADRDIPKLLRLKASVRFLSCEPLLGKVSLIRYLGKFFECPECCFDSAEAGMAMSGKYCGICAEDCGRDVLLNVKGDTIHWVIVGGESGSHARPMHPQWARTLRDQCQHYRAAFHFKQWGEYLFAEKIAHSFEWQASNGWRVNFFKNRDDSENPDKWEWFAPDEPTNLLRMRKVGTKAAGRLLDGRTWDEYPEATPCK